MILEWWQFWVECHMIIFCNQKLLVIGGEIHFCNNLTEQEITSAEPFSANFCHPSICFFVCLFFNFRACKILRFFIFRPTFVSSRVNKKPLTCLNVFLLLFVLQIFLKEGMLMKLSRKVMQPRMFFLVQWNFSPPIFVFDLSFLLCLMNKITIILQWSVYSGPFCFTLFYL